MKITQNRNLPGFIFIFFAVWGVYLNALDNEFEFDDFHSIEANRSIRSLDRIPSYFTDPTTFSDLPWMTMYRPVLLVTYAVNYSLTGPGEMGFNIGNILIHTINALLIYSLLLRYYSGAASLSASLFFALAPICTQAVNYKSSRSVLLVALFVLLSFMFYSKFRERVEKKNQKATPFILYSLSLLFYALGLLSKEITITFPAILLLYEYLFGRTNDPGGEQFIPFVRAVLRWQMPFWIVSLIYLALRKSFFGVATMTVSKVTLIEGAVGQPRSILSNIATQSVSNFIYLREALVPYGLSIIHDFEEVSGFLDWRVIASLLLFFSLFVVAIRARKREPLLLFGLFWFCVSLLPETLIPLNIKVNESRAYFPLAGFSFCVAAFCNYSFSRYQKPAIILFSCYLLVSAAAAFNRNVVWNDGWSLWSDTVKKAPNSPRAHYNLGSISNTDKNYEQAIRFFDRAIELSPLFYRPYNMRGVVLFKLGRLKEAVDSLTVAVKLRPQDNTTHYNLGIAYARLNEFKKAEKLFQKSLEVRADFTPAIIGLGKISEVNGDTRGALILYTRALGLEPDNREARERADSIRKSARGLK